MMQNVVNKLDRGAMTGLNARPKSDISLLIRKNHDSENNRKKKQHGYRKPHELWMPDE